MNPCDVMILCGGLGTRLRVAVPDRQKCAAPVAGTPFVLRLIRYCMCYGLSRFVLCTGHLGPSLRAVVTEEPGCSLAFSEETAPLGTGGAVAQALPLVHTDAFLVLNGDSFCPVELPHLVHYHCTRGAVVTMAVAVVRDASDYGSVLLAGDGQVTRFGEKCTGGNGAVNAGVYVFDRGVSRFFPTGILAFSLEKGLFPALVGKGLYGYPTHAALLDIGTPERLAMAEAFFRNRGGLDVPDLYERSPHGRKTAG